jgi:hypothetical protein
MGDRVAWSRREMKERSPSSWKIPGRGLMTRFHIAWRIAVAKRLLTTPLLWRDRISRKVVLAWFMCPEVRQATGLGQLVADLVTLGLVRDAANEHGECDFGVAMSYDAERGELRYESCRRGSEGTRASREVLAPVPRGPLLSIIWDHGRMGPWVSPRLSRPGWGRWVGPDAQYRFDGLLRLAMGHEKLVWEALLSPSRGDGRVSGSS